MGVATGREPADHGEEEGARVMPATEFIEGTVLTCTHDDCGCRVVV